MRGRRIAGSRAGRAIGPRDIWSLHSRWSLIRRSGRRIRPCSRRPWHRRWWVRRACARPGRSRLSLNRASLSHYSDPLHFQLGQLSRWLLRRQFPRSYFTQFALRRSQLRGVAQEVKHGAGSRLHKCVALATADASLNSKLAGIAGCCMIVLGRWCHLCLEKGGAACDRYDKSNSGHNEPRSN